jgi:hypothetical protein
MGPIWHLVIKNPISGECFNCISCSLKLLVQVQITVVTDTDRAIELTVSSSCSVQNMDINKHK